MRNLIDKFNKVNSAIIAIAVFIFLAGISLISIHMGQIGCDMGEYINNPLRIINGDLPYRDFWLLFSPGEVYFPALIYKIFGINADAVKVVSILFSSLIAVFAFYLGKMLIKDNFESFIFAILFFFTSIITKYVGPDYIHLYLLFIIISAMYLIKFIQEEKMIDIFLSGIAIGCSFFFRIYEVGAALAGFSLTLLIFLIINKKSLTYSIKSILLYIFGIVIMIFIILAAFHSIIPDMYRELIAESVKNGTSMNQPYFHEVYMMIDSLKGDILKIVYYHQAGALGLIVYHFIKLLHNLTYYIFPFLAVIIFVLYLRTKPSKKELSIALVLFLWGIISFPKGLGRSDTAHLAPALTPLLFLLLYTTMSFIRNKSLNKKLIKFIHSFYIFIVIILIIPGFYVFAKYIQEKNDKSLIVYTSHGYSGFRTSEEAKEFQFVVNYIEKNTTSNDYIFVTPWDAPPIYALTNRRDPTYYDSMNDPVVRPSIERQNKLCNALISHNTKVIILSPDWGYDNKPEQRFSIACSVIQNFIETHYKLIYKGDFYYIYVP